MSELDRFINCWLKYRKVDSVRQLDGECQQLICKFINAIANDDKDFVEELKEDVEYCSRVS